MKKLLLSFAVFLTISSCSSVEVRDARVKVHWIEKGEKAPFRGILLNDYTYYKLRKKLLECEK
jgi:uncharacterized protein YceK